MDADFDRAAGFFGRAEFGERVAGAGDVVADAADVDDRAFGVGVDQLAAEVCEHVGGFLEGSRRSLWSCRRGGKARSGWAGSGVGSLPAWRFRHRQALVGAG